MGFTNAAALSMLTGKIGSCQVALFQSPPDDNGTGGTEPGNASYSRVSATLKQTTGSQKQVQNHEVIKFDIARGDGWGTITHFGLYSGGSLVFWDALTEPVTIPANTIPVFDIGALIIGLDKAALDDPNPVPPTD